MGLHMCVCVCVCVCVCFSGVDGNAETPVTVSSLLCLEYQQQKLNSQSKVFFPQMNIREEYF